MASQCFTDYLQGPKTNILWRSSNKIDFIAIRNSDHDRNPTPLDWNSGIWS